MYCYKLRCCCAVSSFPKLGARAWATDYVIAIKGKIKKPRTSKRYGIVRVRSFDMGSADSRQDDQVKTLARAWNMEGRRWAQMPPPLSVEASSARS